VTLWTVSDERLLLFLVQVLLLLGLARGLGELMRRFGQPPLVGEILIGVGLGPTILGRALPELQGSLFPPDPMQQAMLGALSWFGVLFLLLETGLEVDLTAAWRQRGPALRIGVIGVLVPLLIGTALTLGLPDRYFPDPADPLPFALFLGTTMAISAMVIIARVLHDLDLVKSELGLVTLCGYAVNDVLSWVIFSVVISLAGQELIGAHEVVFHFAFTIAFTALCLTVGRALVERGIAYITRQLPNKPGAVLSFVCCLGLLVGAITQWAGLTALFGFFLAGIMAGQAQVLSERTRHVIGQMVHSIFVPLYFASIGLAHDFLANFDALLVSFVAVVSIGVKFLGAWLGALRSDLSRQDRISIGIAFTPSGVTGIVVAGVALELGILTTEVFVAIVFSAIFSSMLVAPLLSWSIRSREPMDLLDFVLRDAVRPELMSLTRWNAIEEMCAAVAEEPNMPQLDKLVMAVCAREEVMGTAMGHVIAIPHARLPELERPVVTLGRSTPGIDWDAPDGLPVHLIFLVLTPREEHGHQLQILAAIAAAMVNEDARNRLYRADDTSRMWSALEEALRAQTLSRVTGEEK
jgi:Kef-type K+ transport system membrane component KefB